MKYKYPFFSLILHGLFFGGIFWWSRFYSPTSFNTLEMAPCTVPLEVTAVSEISQAPISKPKVEDAADKKKSSTIIEKIFPEKEEEKAKEKEKEKDLPRPEPTEKEDLTPSQPVEKEEVKPMEEKSVEDKKKDDHLKEAPPKDPPAEKVKSLDDLLNQMEKEENKKKKPKKAPSKKASAHKKTNSKKDVTSKQKKKTIGDDEDFTNILKDLSKKNRGPSAQTPQTSPDSDSPYGAARVGSLSMSIIDRVRQVLQRAWRVPTLAHNGEKLVVIVQLAVNPDGTVRSANVIGGTRSHPAFQVASESAIAAAYDPSCNPLPLPLDMYDQWKELTIHFSQDS